MATLKLEESLKHLSQCADLERQLKILSEPFAIMEHALSFIARLNNTQRVEISIKQGDVCRRLAVATRDQVLFEQNTAIPDHVRTSRPYFRIERAPSGWIYSLPLWETDRERWQLRCFLTRLCQEDLGWIDVVVEQMLEAVDRTVSVKEVNSHLQHNSADYGQLVTMEKMASIGMVAAGAAHEIHGPAAYVRANIGMMEGYLRDIDRALARFEDLLEKSGNHELLDGWRKTKKGGETERQPR